MALNKSYVIAGSLAIALAGWLLSGQVGGDEPHDAASSSADQASQTAADEPMMVRVRDLAAETIQREIVVNGKTASRRMVQVRAETDGRVIELIGQEGKTVEDGAVLVRLDPRDRAVSALEAEAYLSQRRIELEAASRLGEKGFQAETAVAQAKANYAAAEAALKRAELEQDRTVITAPFAGKLDRHHVEIGDFVDIGDPVATVLDQDPFLVTGDVTETEVGLLEAGMVGSVRLATGDGFEGTLSYVASRADEQTRTFEVELEVPNPDGRLADGISAEIRIAVEHIPAHRISPSVLTLSDDGTLGVKGVDDRDIVVFMPVEIAKADRDQVWLTGLPEDVRLITVGQGFVSDGVRVTPMLESDIDRQDGAAGPVVSEAAQ